MQHDTPPQESAKPVESMGEKRPYERPELVDHGSIGEVTRTTGAGETVDGGGAPGYIS